MTLILVLEVYTFLETQKNNYQSHRLYEQMGFIQDSEFKTFHCFLKWRLLKRNILA